MSKDHWKDGQALTTPMTSSRRGFILGTAAAGLGAGFAIASGPVQGQAIKTDFDGIACDEVMVASDGTDIPAYIAKPAGTGTKFPTILVISEIFGVHEYIADTCRRLAKLGYLAMAPDLFTRAGDPNEFGTIAEIMTNVGDEDAGPASHRRPEVMSCMGFRARRRRHARRYHRILLGRPNHLACLRAYR